MFAFSICFLLADIWLHALACYLGIFSALQDLESEKASLKSYLGNSYGAQFRNEFGSVFAFYSVQ